ncbi:PIG-U-domain-containing protein [Dacryopinax primogenitus]|uniref:PIG-U-domain-containing protein n=1 Tax=Dacryopinax primogenitus (strain DJM 731) TaxID=1858805 RepID=M5G247_DACPD|nr:PIG-U-domain-containing protein [Dacryopinax primogenitus]EJU04266.1 PIG-U-domain-containing protein [Dacryopinax primogenitus]
MPKRLSGAAYARPALLIPALLLLLRFSLILSPLSPWLRDDHQLASPLTSFTRLKEGIWFFQKGIDPYHGGVFRHSPLTLALFTLIPPIPLVSALLWTVADGIAAWCLAEIWRARIAPRGHDGRGVLLASLYLSKPYNFLPTVALSSSSLDNAFLLLALRFAALQQVSPSLILLAVLSFSSLPSILLLPPLVMILLAGPKPTVPLPKYSPKTALRIVAEFALYMVVLTGASRFVAGSWGWVLQTWGATVMLPDLTPNPGLWWYFFTEMFDQYRPFFLLTFSLHPLIYVAPMCLKFQHDPLFAFFLLQGIISTFKSYPTLSDAGLYISLLGIFPEIYSHFRHPLVTALLHLHAALLLPLFHYLWLDAGTGNANFFYASTLVFGLANGSTIVEALWAGLHSTIGEKEGWEVVQL